MKTKTKTRTVPTCVFCGRSGSGVQFAIFSPRFQPFGTACVACEDSLPPGTQVPAVVAQSVPAVSPGYPGPCPPPGMSWSSWYAFNNVD